MKFRLSIIVLLSVLVSTDVGAMPRAHISPPTSHCTSLFTIAGPSAASFRAALESRIIQETAIREAPELQVSFPGTTSEMRTETQGLKSFRISEEGNRRRELFAFDLSRREVQSARTRIRQFIIEVWSPESRFSVGSFTYQVEEGALIVAKIDVNERFRGQGIQDLAYAIALRENPTVAKIRVDNLVSVNQEVAAAGLLRRVRQDPAFARLNAGPQPTSAELENLADKHRTFYSSSPSSFELNRCCSNYLNQLKKTDPDRFAELVRQALTDTPAYRTRLKLGFGRFCDAIDASLSPSFGLSVRFDVCR